MLREIKHRGNWRGGKIAKSCKYCGHIFSVWKYRDNNMRTLKPFLIALVLVALGYTSIASAAPAGRYEFNLWPVTTNTYELGTSSLRWYRSWTSYASTTQLSADSLCLNSDTCRTTWPSGSGSFAWTVQSWGVSTSTTLGFLNGFLSTASSTIDSTLLVTGSTTLQNFTATRSTTTQATTTNFASTNLSATNIFNISGSGLTFRTSGNGTNNDFSFTAGNATGGDLAGGVFTFQAGTGIGAGLGGSITLTGGTGGGSSGGGAITLTPGTGGSVGPSNGGDLNLKGGQGVGTPGNGSGGSINLDAGTAPGGGTTGKINLNSNASSTLLTANYASSTLWYGGGLLNTCASGSFLTWTGGVFGCDTDDNTGAFPFTPDSYAGTVVNATSTGLWLKGSPLGLIASTTFATNSTSTNATSTNLFTTTASTTNFFGADLLSSCNGTANKLTYTTGGKFLCEADQNSGGSGAPDTKWATSTGSFVDAIFPNAGTGNTLVGIGTSTPSFQLTVSSSTRPQISLTDGSVTSNHWTIRSISNALYFATSSPSTYATSSVSALSINANGVVNIPNNLDVDTLTSALVLTGAGGDFAEYTGTTCTNQFVRVLSALGVATCATVGTADVAGLDISDDTNLAATWPIILTGDTLSFGGLSTSSPIAAGAAVLYATGVNTLASIATSTPSVTSPITYSGTLGNFVGGSSGSFGCATCALTSTTLTIAGTAQQITSSAGAQDISANRTWTLSLPDHVVFPNTFQATRSTTTHATTTNLDITSLLTFNGVTSATWAGFCQTITGGAGLCDGSDDGGAGTSAFEIATTSDIAVPNLAYFTKTSGRTTLGSVATTTLAGTANQISVSNSPVVLGSSGAVLTLPSHVIFPTSYQASLGSTTNATSTNLTVTGNTILSGMTSALLQAGSDGLIAEYAGTSCTNQFVRSLSVLGAATCATVGTADVSGLDISDDTNLAATWPIVLTGDTLSFGAGLTKWATTTVDSRAIETASALTVGISTSTPMYALTIASTTAPQLSLTAGAGVAQWTFRNAGGSLYVSTTTVAGTATTTTAAFSILSTGEVIARNLFQIINTSGTLIMNVVGSAVTLLGSWDFGGATSVEVPNGGPTVDTTGEIGVDTTDDQLLYYGASSKRVVQPFDNLGFAYATSTWSGTTTLRIGPSPAAITITHAYCETNTGTVGVSLYDGTNRALYMATASTTINKFLYTASNNSFTAGETIRVDVGTPASSPQTLSCRFMYTYDAT